MMNDRVSTTWRSCVDLPTQCLVSQISRRPQQFPVDPGVLGVFPHIWDETKTIPFHSLVDLFIVGELSDRDDMVTDVWSPSCNDCFPVCASSDTCLPCNRNISFVSSSVDRHRFGRCHCFNHRFFETSPRPNVDAQRTTYLKVGKMSSQT
ncbi:uncharacterized protein BDZ99DRAFT_134738 [Mytilinidion resinicola]|uniref:Uncharacterized protein n=1 Tax=Mytilinidion resinicola TaxID=574789 RepID=A0A6A6Z6T1_9PEZI|nr:uncharacterized protein BDZ99DRAFT_134738 [Mytilinidion resinicola]KAF2816373.1 hypothetical protein BDZ99DRAFT_134738 [Mytilinidion resinicola]